MDTKNMDAFNEYASKIFDRLYSKFPKRFDISLTDFAEDASDHSQSEIFHGTMSFLAREGYLAYENIAFGANYSMVVLTAKGLAVLDAVPESVQNNESFIQKIRMGLKAGGREAAKSAIKSLITYGVTSLVR